ncbi:MAG TPA: hypothetical protein VI503_03670 [Gaiellaceae bacterium]|nr:hypothetical protein [Gaiellaceae bacterium]
MKRTRLHRPSPAMVIACIALAVALGGTGYAQIVLPANSVGTKQLRNNSVASPKIRNAAVTNRKLARNSVTGAKVKANSLTGGHVLESSLGQVPSAASAETAASAMNAAQLGGVAADGYLRTTNVVFGTFTTSAGGASVVEARSKGLTGVSRAAAGFYNATFNRDVSNCTWIATGGNTGVGTPAYIATTRAPSAGGPNAVGVVVWSGAGAQVDGASVFVEALCP